MLAESEIYKKLVEDSFDTYNVQIKNFKSLHRFL